MKEQIIELLTNNDKKFTTEEITKRLINADQQTVQNLLNELEQEYLIYKTNKNKYMLFSKNEYYRIGKLTLNKKGLISHTGLFRCHTYKFFHRGTFFSVNLIDKTG